MARILLAWELGGGLGHIVPLARMGKALARAGHDCAYVLRDLARAHALLDVRTSCLYQAPLFLPEHRTGTVAHTFADILGNIGYRRPGALTGLLSAWRRIYADFRPDLVVLDHAPTAQAALRGLGMPSIMLAASGFTLPPAVTPLPGLRSDPPDTPAARQQREAEITASLNAALGALDVPEVAFIGQLFEAKARVLFSIPELDPYEARSDVEYWGPIEAAAGVQPEWPPGGGKKIFAYLGNFPTRGALLDAVAAIGQPALVCASGMDAAACAALSRGTLRLSPRLFDVGRVLDECDLVITHGGTLACSALLAGKPMLTLPLHLEQQLTATKIQSLGASLNAPRLAPAGMRGKLDRLLNEPAFGIAARRFAACDRELPAGQEERFVRLVAAQL